MANRKPPRADADIQTLAVRWRTAWRPSDGIEPWLRRHLAELIGLIHHEHWSWDDLARALNETAIRYATGRPWSAARLSSKVRRLRARQRQAVIYLAPKDLAAAVRDALAGTSGDVANITINVLGAVPPSPEHPTGPARQRADASHVTAQELRPPPDGAADALAEPGFAFARLKGGSPHASPPASEPAPEADTIAQSAPVTADRHRVGRILQELLSRPRHGSIPNAQPILEPDDE